MKKSIFTYLDNSQLNMMYGYWKSGRQDQIGVFDVSLRSNPAGNCFYVFAGLERIVLNLQGTLFTEDDINFLKTQPEQYEEGFFQELRQFQFSGDIHSVTEGTIIFSDEPIIRIKSKLFEFPLIESILLNFINTDTLAATQAARMKIIDPKGTFIDLSSHKLLSGDKKPWAARSSYLAGYEGTVNIKASCFFGIPLEETHHQSWVNSFESELDAFRSFIKVHPNNATLLVDAYDPIRSGVPNAIRAAKELEQMGKRMKAIQINSGDLAYISQKSRKMLDNAGLDYVKIIASGDLNEEVIFNLLNQEAKIDGWFIDNEAAAQKGNLDIEAASTLAAMKQDGTYLPKIKMSSNPEKISIPGYKNLYRIINNETGKAEGDYITLHDEKINLHEPLHLFHPIHPHLQKRIQKFTAVPLLRPIIENGRVTCELPSLEQIRQYHKKQLDYFWDEYLRNLNPHLYPVDLSHTLWELRRSTISGKQITY